LNPSRHPSCIPSHQPSVKPTCQPSTHPSSIYNDRKFYCDDSLECETKSLSNCTFFSPNVTLIVSAVHIIQLMFTHILIYFVQCVNSSIPCVFYSSYFTVGPGTHINVEGGCELQIWANEDFNIYQNSSLQVLCKMRFETLFIKKSK
jgi:hypothetical protein